MRSWGDTLARRVISRLNGTWALDIEFSPLTVVNLSDFKNLVRRYLTRDYERGEPYLPQDEPLDKVMDRVELAKSVWDVFEVIGVPPPEEALDVL